MRPPFEPQDDEPGGSRPRPPTAAVVLAVTGILLAVTVISIARHSSGAASPGQPGVHATASPPPAGQRPALTAGCATTASAATRSGAPPAAGSSQAPARDGPGTAATCNR